MVPLLDANRETLQQLCARHRVARLELFGSAARDGFDPDSSDLDFLVEFLPLRPGEYADEYFAMLSALESLFHRPVDLVMTRAIRNRYFLQSVNETRVVLYAA